MNKLSIFEKGISEEVTVVGMSNLEELVSELSDEAKLLRAGFEEFSWGELVEDLDLEDPNLRMEEING